MNEAPRVLFVNHTLDPEAGGAEKVLQSLLQGLPAEGLALELAVPGSDDGQELAAGVTCHRLPPLRMVRSRSMSNLFATAVSLARIHIALTWLLIRRRPDLVYVNSVFALHFCVIPALLCRIPFVYHEHNLVSQRSESIWDIAFARLVRRARMVVAISKAVANEIRLATGLPVGRVRVVYNAIDEAPIPRRLSRDSTARGRFRVVQIANLHRWKGHATVIEAIAIARRSGLEVSATFFGRDQDPPFTRQLKSRAEELGVDKHVEFAGFVAEPRSRLAEFDSLVLASEAEPFGLAILEGMSAAIPVAATAAGGALEIIDDGRTGLLFPPKDAAALAGCWRRLIESPELSRTLVSNALQELSERFSGRAQVSGVASAIKECLR